MRKPGHLMMLRIWSGYATVFEKQKSAKIPSSDFVNLNRNSESGLGVTKLPNFQ
jgi:hypothetical protein